MERADLLRSIASEVLNERGVSDVEELLEDGELKRAESYILGGLDACVHREVIDHDRAKELYKILNVDPDRANTMRANHTGGGTC